MAILPSFLLKSLQLIPLLCQGRLQVQVASIMGQLKGTVIRLNKERTQINNEQSLTLITYEKYSSWNRKHGGDVLFTKD